MNSRGNEFCRTMDFQSFNLDVSSQYLYIMRQRVGITLQV